MNTKKMQETYYIGIDPGKSGGIIVLNEAGGFERAITDHFEFAKYIGLIGLIRIKGVLFKAGIEKVHSFPEQGVKSTFTFGEDYGVWQGIMIAYGISYEKIPPIKWRKIVGTKIKGKEPIVEFAKRKWPNVSFIKKKDWWQADALCIAEYVRLKDLRGEI